MFSKLFLNWCTPFFRYLILSIFFSALIYLNKLGYKSKIMGSFFAYKLFIVYKLLIKDPEGEMLL